VPLHHPACFSGERVQLNAAEQAELNLKTPWRDGTTLLPTSRRRNARKLPVATVNSCLGLSDTCPLHATDARMPPS
jgi:hypothetical protein